jgi:hypothetical protein
VLDDAQARRREWRKALATAAVLLLVLAPIYSLYQVAVNRAAAQAIAGAEQAIHEVPQEDRLYRPELLLRASSIGEDIADATKYLSDNCGMWQAGAGRAECTQQLVDPIAIAALGELEALAAKPAVPMSNRNLDLLHFSNDPELNNGRMGADSVIALTGTLFRLAREAAPTDTALSMRYLLAAFAISDSANALMIVNHNTVRGWGSPMIAIQTLRPLVEGKFSDEQLAALQAAVPGQVARQVGTTFLYRDLLAIKDFGLAGDGTSDPLDWSEAATGVLFWYEALGVRAWDQIAAATTVRDQARSMHGKGVVSDASNSQFEIPFTPLTDYLWDRMSWGYPYLQQSEREAALLRTALALQRYALAHGEFPERLDALTPDYLAELPIDPARGYGEPSGNQPSKLVDYYYDSPSSVRLGSGGAYLSVSLPGQPDPYGPRQSN